MNQIHQRIRCMVELPALYSKEETQYYGREMIVTLRKDHVLPVHLLQCIYSIILDPIMKKENLNFVVTCE